MIREVYGSMKVEFPGLNNRGSKDRDLRLGEMPGEYISLETIKADDISEEFGRIKIGDIPIFL